MLFEKYANMTSFCSYVQQVANSRRQGIFSVSLLSFFFFWISRTRAALANVTLPKTHRACQRAALRHSSLVITMAALVNIFSYWRVFSIWNSERSFLVLIHLEPSKQEELCNDIFQIIDDVLRFIIQPLKSAPNKNPPLTLNKPPEIRFMASLCADAASGGRPLVTSTGRGRCVQW